MSEKIETGGPAFPRQPGGDTGMTLRDYFAAKAMHGMAGSRRYCEVGWDQADMASQAYEIADAMLKARGVKHGQG